MSPQAACSFELQHRASTGEGPPKKRASRAGTRSVLTLTKAQLERKRANDRETQRAIRQRTKKRIEDLEQRIQELSDEKTGTRLLQALQRNSELEQEIVVLRSRLSQNIGALLQSKRTSASPCPPHQDWLPGISRESTMLSVATSKAMHQQRQTITRPEQGVACFVAARPQQDDWQHQSDISIASATSATSATQDFSNEKQHQQHNLIHPMIQSQGERHTAPLGQSSYVHVMPTRETSQVKKLYKLQQATSSLNPFQLRNDPRTVPQ